VLCIGSGGGWRNAWWEVMDGRRGAGREAVSGCIDLEVKELGG
jgi:hypothetical protein